MNTQEPAYWQQIEKELRPYFGVFQQAAETIVNENVSNYPLFFISLDEVTVGLSLGFHQSSEEITYHLYASTLEEMVAKNIIALNRVDHFREVYRNARKALCLLLWQDQAHFLFVRP